MRLKTLLIVACSLLPQSTAVAQHEVFLPGIGFFGDPDGSFTEVTARPDGAEVHIRLAKGGPDAPPFHASWAAEGWTRLHILEDLNTRQPGLEVSFSPYRNSFGVRLPRVGESMTLPPSSRGHGFSFLTSWGGHICEDENGVKDFETCFGDFFLTYDVVNVPAPIRGDTNFDDIVDFSDFLTLSKNFGLPDLLVTWDVGDFDLNRRVNFADFLTLSQHFGESRQTPLASVPEPDSSAIALFLVCIGLFVRRKICVASTP